MKNNKQGEPLPCINKVNLYIPLYVFVMLRRALLFHGQLGPR